MSGRTTAPRAPSATSTATAIVGRANIRLGVLPSLVQKEMFQIGVDRAFDARVLARHAVTHDGRPAEAIVGEVDSPADEPAIRILNSTKAGESTIAKMRSAGSGSTIANA